MIVKKVKNYSVSAENLHLVKENHDINNEIKMHYITSQFFKKYKNKKAESSSFH